MYFLPVSPDHHAPSPSTVLPELYSFGLKKA